MKLTNQIASVPGDETGVFRQSESPVQLVEYLRMNGIVPPMTQKYGLKVRD